MFSLAQTSSAQLRIADQAFNRMANGRYELDLTKPLFEEVHKRENVGEQAWQELGKPRMMWAMDYHAAGGTYFSLLFILCLYSTVLKHDLCIL